MTLAGLVLAFPKKFGDGLLGPAEDQAYALSLRREMEWFATKKRSPQRGANPAQESL
jgi:hypothetical protein